MCPSFSHEIDFNWSNLIKKTLCGSVFIVGVKPVLDFSKIYFSKRDQYLLFVTGLICYSLLLRYNQNNFEQILVLVDCWKIDLNCCSLHLSLKHCNLYNFVNVT